jgi:hypothetical protein
MAIHIKQTVKNILSVEDVQFKIIKEDEKTGHILLGTPVNNDFIRGVIVVEKERVGLGTQGPDENGKMTTLFQPLTYEIIQQIAFEEVLVESSNKKIKKGE